MIRKQRRLGRGPARAEPGVCVRHQGHRVGLGLHQRERGGRLAAPGRGAGDHLGRQVLEGVRRRWRGCQAAARDIHLRQGKRKRLLPGT